MACRMDCILGLQGREAKKMSIACCSVKPRHQYMYASAVAGALPNPANQSSHHECSEASIQNALRQTSV